ncbi:MAG: DNA/RNA non-specific endonuclease [Anaerovoracaceae bacterium]
MKHRLKNQTKLKSRRILSLVLALAVFLSIATYQLLPGSNAESTALAASAGTSASGTASASASSTASTASTTSSGLKAPSIQVAPSGYEGLKITWTKVSGAKSYEIYRASSKSGTYKKTAAVQSTGYTDKTTAQNRTYYYKVRAVSGKSKGRFSSVKSGKIRTAVSLKKIPAYSGSPYAEINGGKTYFAKSMYVKKSSQTFSKLDRLGRCGTAFAVVGRNLIPANERGSIGMIKPSGWHTVRYDDLIEDKYLYNRCHLIGYQLTGENVNEQNLITGTRYLNVDGMLPFENRVAEYVRKTGNHVLYRVTPIYDGKDLVARGVEMEASSVEDQGKGLEFHVFVYNVQPGIEIDYATGDSRRASDASGGTSAADPGKQPEYTYVLNTNTKKFHYPTCSSVSQMAEKNKKSVTASRDEIITDGYSPCGNCKP